MSMHQQSIYLPADAVELRRQLTVAELGGSHSTWGHGVVLGCFQGPIACSRMLLNVIHSECLARVM